MSGKLVQVPLSTTRPLRILDSGTGDGTWMVDVSKQYPQAELVGTDIFQKHFEQLKDVPKCISFKVQSVLDDWPAEDHEAYDLVHQRYCLAQFSAEKDAAIVMRLFGNVKPGGYLQIVDANLGGFDGGEGHEAMVKAMDYFIKAFTEHGLEPRPGPSAAEWMRQAGAVDIHEEVMSFNVGIKATTPEDQTGTTVNLTTIIDNFAAIGSRYNLSPGPKLAGWMEVVGVENLQEVVLEVLVGAAAETKEIGQRPIEVMLAALEGVEVNLGRMLTRNLLQLLNSTHPQLSYKKRCQTLLKPI
ncbi:hypothetical protein M7I_7575 [Glarea lozoyensis 74030]|uniref:Methyltransferase domain-containing protein n=1 Tax=Glarea lozoyensis (strain ATCC 74030 / MF5533) TaxID=1104152 RepID=H0EXN6_GLAL7|nr:hypothetical protein M7I_7575 [Glarea lozoyensis 74030]